MLNDGANVQLCRVRQMGRSRGPERLGSWVSARCSCIMGSRSSRQGNKSQPALGAMQARAGIEASNAWDGLREPAEKINLQQQSFTCICNMYRTDRKWGPAATWRCMQYVKLYADHVIPASGPSPTMHRRVGRSNWFCPMRCCQSSVMAHMPSAQEC